MNETWQDCSTIQYLSFQTKTNLTTLLFVWWRHQLFLKKFKNYIFSQNICLLKNWIIEVLQHFFGSICGFWEVKHSSLTCFPGFSQIQPGTRYETFFTYGSDPVANILATHFQRDLWAARINFHEFREFLLNSRKLDFVKSLWKTHSRK